MTVEEITSKYLEKVFNSEEFNSGLAKIIEITKTTGNEAIFGAAKKINENTLIYPPKIIVGDQGSASRKNGMKRATEAYKQTTGKKPLVSIFNELKLFENYCRDHNENYEVPFPHSGSEELWNLELKKGNIQDFYALFNVHTHPSARCIPSGHGGDLIVLNNLRMSYQGIEKITPKSILIIAGILPKQDRKYAKVCFIQERTKFPLSEEEIIKGQKKLHAKYYSLMDESMLRAAFGVRTKEPFNHPNDNYSLALAVFNTKTKKIDFNNIRFPKINWEEFAFVCD